MFISLHVILNATKPCYS